MICVALMAVTLPATVLQKRGELERAAGEAVLKALQSSAAAGGDVLVFMPGVAEIRRLQQLLQQESAVVKAGVHVQQLHGGMSPQQQDEVIRWGLLTLKVWLTLLMYDSTNLHQAAVASASLTSSSARI
jgi:hypothetical protein